MERTLTEWEREQARWSWFRRLLDGNPVIRPPTLADLMADPSELDVACLDCHGAASVLPEVFCQERSHPFHFEDFISNGGLLVSGRLILWLSSKWPDLVIGTAVAGIAI